MIQLNMGLMILLISKTAVTIIRATFLKHLIPLHKNIIFHKYIVVWNLLICIPGHILSHLLGTYPAISSFKNIDDLN